MSNNDLLDLINADLDGETSPEESSRLATLMSQQPEIATMYDETRVFIDRIHSISSVEPPSYLKNRIMSQLAGPKSIPSRSIAAEIIESVKALFQPRFALQLATIFAGGLIIGLTFSQTGWFSEAFDANSAVGTIGVSPADSNQPSEVTLSGIQSHAIATLDRRANQVILTLDGKADEPAVIEVDYPVEQLSIRGLTDQMSPAGEELSATGGNVRVVLQTAGSLTLVFDAVDGSEVAVNVSLREPGREVITSRLTIQ